jgi:hypothetical protein
MTQLGDNYLARSPRLCSRSFSPWPQFGVVVADPLLTKVDIKRIRA